jgi:hypothetical protein
MEVRGQHHATAALPPAKKKRYHARFHASTAVKSTTWPLQMERIGCPETSIRNYQSTLRKILEECTSQSQYTLNRRLAGSQSRSGSFGKEKCLLLLPGFELRTVHSTAESISTTLSRFRLSLRRTAIPREPPG